MSAHREKQIGVAYGVGAFVWWGGAVLYFKAVAHVPPMEVLAHRIIWSVVLLLLILVAGRRFTALRSLFADRRTMLALTATTLLIAINWYIFIWAIGSGQILQTSLGYFINPLVNVLLGFLFLRERLTPLQLVSLLLAAVAVAILTVDNGSLPIPGLVLAVTFGFYGLLRKVVPVDGVTGLAAETILLLPAAIAYLVYIAQEGRIVFAQLNWSTDLLLLLAGVVTSVPLIWHVNAAKRLRYATVGLMLYISPSISFLIAVFLYQEPFSTGKLISFCLIWAALALYSFTAIRRRG